MRRVRGVYINIPRMKRRPLWWVLRFFGLAYGGLAGPQFCNGEHMTALLLFVLGVSLGIYADQMYGKRRIA